MPDLILESIIIPFLLLLPEIQQLHDHQNTKKSIQNWNLQMSEVNLSPGKQWMYPLLHVNANYLQRDPQYNESEILNAENTGTREIK